MADAYEPDETDNKTKKPKKEDNGEVCRLALKRYHLWSEREQANVKAAYEDLGFCWEDLHWPDAVVRERSAPGNTRPMLTVNTLPQFVHQVTGDMRQMQPSIKVVPVDSRGDQTTAETMGGMIRYVENRSDAGAIYTAGADSQVSCGIGAWRVNKEYAAESTFNQELRVVGVDDAVAIAWDPDAVLPTREDAKWCIVPVDMSKEAFEEQYPDAPMSDFDDAGHSAVAGWAGWYSSDSIRVAEYWVKKPIKRTLALMPDGAISDLTNADPDDVAQAKAGGGRIEERDSFKVCRYLITCAHVLEGRIDWPGMHIPIIPVIGEEIRIGRKVVRRGLIKSAKDAQRMLNYYFTAHTEVVGLQPKAPFIGTEKNFEKYQTEWGRANQDALPYLPYTPDPTNGGARPERVPPPVSSQGITEGITLANQYIKSVIGIYDPSLGNKSQEVSGKAIIAREKQGDTGTYVYIDNWRRAIRRTGAILIDLIPHVYDTERMIRIMGEDGKVDLKWINRPIGMNETHPVTGEPKEPGKIENDVTIGAYDVVLETGPSYSTKREEAKANMVEFIRSAPETAPVVMDLVAKSQDWPLADEFSKRLEAVAPPAVQQLIANQKKERGEEQPPPQPPSPAEQMQQQAMQLDLENKHLTNEKLKVDMAVALQSPKTGPVDPAEAIKTQQELQQAETMNQLAVQQAQMKMQSDHMDLQHKARMGELEFAHSQQDLAAKRAQANGTDASTEMGEFGGEDGQPVPAERRHGESLQAMQQIADSFQAGMEAIARAMAAPKQIEVSRDQRGNVVGATSSSTLN